jgi:putative PEP-CTERM system histidine kinase
MSDSFLSFAAAAVSGVLALIAVLGRRRTFATWCFAAGMAALAVECVLNGLSVDSVHRGEVAWWQELVFVARCLESGIWLTFSLTYSRGNYREFLWKWRFILGAVYILPILAVLCFHRGLIEVLANSTPGYSWWIRFGAAAKALNVFILITTVLILVNLENTFRSTIGTMRWRIKFVVLGFTVLLGSKIYTGSEALLFSGQSLSMADIEACAILIGCALIGIAYLRSGLTEVDVYPSQAVLSSSLTALLVGGYLFVVGVLAQIVARLGGTGSIQAQAAFLLLAFAVLAVLLASDRLRQKVRVFVSRHFLRPQHDFRKVWTRVTQQLTTETSSTGLCTAAAKLISETFDVLSVTLWLVDKDHETLVPGASTSRLDSEFERPSPAPSTLDPIRMGVSQHPAPFDLEQIKGDWAERLRQLGSTQFQEGGNRVCVSLFAGETWLGLAILADRVNGVPYTAEEFDLLKCIGDQIAAGLLTVRLNEDVLRAKELEAFQTMSTFFVHDLKNAVSGLNLMLRNLPVHFDDPEFRKDALRGIGNTASRIDKMIERLSALRNTVQLNPVESDLNQLVNETLESLKGLPDVELSKDLAPLPSILADPEQLKSVITNLLLNARDAVQNDGKVRVETAQRDATVVLSVTDDGCGMSSAFLKNSLFRPFHTTKKAGLGIGMFQSRLIVEAHHGGIQVESEPGNGTTFRVSLPLKTQP